VDKTTLLSAWELVLEKAVNSIDPAEKEALKEYCRDELWSKMSVWRKLWASFTITMAPVVVIAGFFVALFATGGIGTPILLQISLVEMTALLGAGFANAVVLGSESKKALAERMQEHSDNVRFRILVYACDVFGLPRPKGDSAHLKPLPTMLELAQPRMQAVVKDWKL
jgi:hypothetical protein